MRRNERGLLFLFLVFVVLGVIVLFQDDLSRVLIPPAPVPTTETIFKRVFPDLAVMDIQAVQIADQETNASLTIARGDNGEWVAPGLDGTLDQEAATNIARTFALLPYVYTVPAPDNADLSDFGLDPANVRLYFLILMRDGREYTVAVGDPLATAPEFYACVDDLCTRDPGEIHILQRGPVNYLAVMLADPPVE